MYGVPPRGHIDMCSYIISVVYKRRIILSLKGLALFYHFPHTYGMHLSLEIYLKKKPETASMPITKTKHV